MALEPITRQEQIIAGKELNPITRMEKFLKQYGGASGGAGAGTMVVNISAVSAMAVEAGPQYVADKTYEEIQNAVLSGKIVVANFNSIDGIMVSQLADVNPDFAGFCCLTGPYMSVLYLYQDNHIEIESFELTVSR